MVVGVNIGDKFAVIQEHRNDGIIVGSSRSFFLMCTAPMNATVYEITNRETYHRLQLELHFAWDISPYVSSWTLSGDNELCGVLAKQYPFEILLPSSSVSVSKYMVRRSVETVLCTSSGTRASCRLSRCPYDYCLASSMNGSNIENKTLDWSMKVNGLEYTLPVAAIYSPQSNMVEFGGRIFLMVHNFNDIFWRGIIVIDLAEKSCTVSKCNYIPQCPGGETRMSITPWGWLVFFAYDRYQSKDTKYDLVVVDSRDLSLIYKVRTQLPVSEFHPTMAFVGDKGCAYCCETRTVYEVV